MIELGLNWWRFISSFFLSLFFVTWLIHSLYILIYRLFFCMSFHTEIEPYSCALCELNFAFLCDLLISYKFFIINFQYSCALRDYKSQPKMPHDALCISVFAVWEIMIWCIFDPIYISSISVINREIFRLTWYCIIWMGPNKAARKIRSIAEFHQGNAVASFTTNEPYYLISHNWNFTCFTYIHHTGVICIHEKIILLHAIR